jgi:hypothetical protein
LMRWQQHGPIRNLPSARSMVARLANCLQGGLHHASAGVRSDDCCRNDRWASEG